MSEWPRRYLTHVEVECGYARNTLHCYGRTLEDFLRFVGERGPKLRRLRGDDLRRYVLELRDGRRNSARSIRLKLQAIRSLLGYLQERGAGPRLILFGKNDFRYKVEHREAASLSQLQLGLLLDALTTAVHEARRACEREVGKTQRLRKRLFAARRELCLLVLLAGTGLRIGEALGIRFADIDAVDKSIRITGKGKKIREVMQLCSPLSNTEGLSLERVRSAGIRCRERAIFTRTGRLAAGISRRRLTSAASVSPSMTRE